MPEIPNHAGEDGIIERAERIVTPSSLAATMYDGGIDSRQLKTKNSTLRQMIRYATFMIFLHLPIAASPYFSRLSTANVEMIGVWLKAKTITGIEIHTWCKVC
ncbi:hypothetical protein D3C85_1726890 [compost metagenome]